MRQRIAIVAAGPIANFLLAITFFWVLAMLGSQQVRPVIGAVESGSIAAKAGLVAGQEIVSIDGEPTTGWSAVNLQLVRRLGESGTLRFQVRASTLHANWFWIAGCKGPMSRIRSSPWVFALGVRPYRRCWLNSIR